jgi:hypothetical protein
MRRIHSRIAPLAAVVQEASGSEPGLRALAEQGKEQRRMGMKVLAQVLADREALKPYLTASQAADALWLFNDPATYQRLVVDRRWSGDSYQQWMADALISVLIADDYRPVVEAGRPPGEAGRPRRRRS